MLKQNLLLTFFYCNWIVYCLVIHPAYDVLQVAGLDIKPVDAASPRLNTRSQTLHNFSVYVASVAVAPPGHLDCGLVVFTFGQHHVLVIIDGGKIEGRDTLVFRSDGWCE